MSYEPTNWKAGDTVTSAKLNKIEQGIVGNIASNTLIVTYYNDLTDKTWQEIADAVLNGQCVYLKEIIDDEGSKFIMTPLMQIQYGTTPYYVKFGNTQFMCYSSDDYLTIDA